MKQKRIQRNLCQTPKLFEKYFNNCYVDYSDSNEEKRSFSLRWINQTNHLSNTNSSIDRAFLYEKEPDGERIVMGKHGIYSKSGFIYEYRGRIDELRKNLIKLNQLNWIDQQTRVVMIEMTLYNPNVQLLTSVILLSEFLSTGGVETSSSIQPISFQRLFLL